MSFSPRNKAALVAAATIILMTAGAASGETHNPFDSGRTDVGFGMLVGGYSVGSVGGTGIGAHIDAGHRWGRKLYVFGEYNLLTIGDDPGPDGDRGTQGKLNRLGIVARYSLGDIGKRKLNGAFWIEGGLGRQYVSWDEGGRLTRDDTSFGFGGQFNVACSARGEGSVFGFYYALKGMVARAPGTDKMQLPGCAGPCDEPTAPSPYDVGVFLNVGVVWSK